MDFLLLLINRFYYYVYILKKNFYIQITKILISFKKKHIFNSHDLKFLKNGRIEVGIQLIKGSYVFSSVNLKLKEDNIFKNKYPSKDVEESIFGFDWLNDLSLLANTKARIIAYGWLCSWLYDYSFEKECKKEINVLVKRQTNFIHNLNFLRKTLGEEKFHSFTQKIIAEKIFLNFLINDLDSNFLKLKILYSSFWLEIFLNSNFSKRNQYMQKISEIILKLLNKKLFIESRKPDELLEIFIIITDLIKNTDNKYFKKNKSRKKIILIQKKLIPIIRGLRLGNGALTRFHGGDIGNIELIDKSLSCLDKKEEGVSNNSLGIERITAGRIILLLDSHTPPLNNASLDSHASCLSFELSSGQRPIFVNCGPGGKFGIEYKRFCRNTSAHNTSSIDNKSQVEFRSIFSDKEFAKEIIFKGPKKVNINRGKSIDAKWIEGSHDGYYENFGIIHRRKIILLKSGNTISGSDLFTKKSKLFFNFDLNVETFFHLHPDVEITNQPHINSIILRLLNGEHWIFESKIGRPVVKESIYIDSNFFQPLNTKVIILRNKILEKDLLINWSLRRREIVSRHTRDIKILRN